MTENMMKFLEVSSKDGEIQNELIKANNDYFNTVIAAAKDVGIELSPEDIVLLLRADKNHDGRISEEEFASLSTEESNNVDDELDSVSGGTYTYVEGYGTYMSDCGCAFFGGGSSDNYQKTCACILGGAGELTDYGKQEAAAGHIHASGSSSAPVAMYCPGVGSGHCD